MVKDSMDLLELLRKRGVDGDTDFLREALRVLMDAIMDAEVSARIGAGSLYSSKSPRERMMIDKFLERTLAYSARMATASSRQDFTLLDVLRSDVAELTESCLSALGLEGRQPCAH